MKKFLLIIVFFTFNIPCSAQILDGGIKYDVISAQEELLTHTAKPVSQNLLRANIIDTNSIENKTLLLKGETAYKDRTLGKFSDGSYAIIYNNTPEYVWYYNSDGILTHCEVKSSITYPYKTYKYNNLGKLINMSLRVSEQESFIYTTDGKLLAHWLSGNCYNSQGQIIMTREIYK